jgi:hypothetical protein
MEQEKNVDYAVIGTPDGEVDLLSHRYSYFKVSKFDLMEIVGILKSVNKMAVITRISLYACYEEENLHREVRFESVRGLSKLARSFSFRKWKYFFKRLNENYHWLEVEIDPSRRGGSLKGSKSLLVSI